MTYGHPSEFDGPPNPETPELEPAKPCSSGSAGWTLDDYLERQRKWSYETFGHGPRTKGITAHIRKELQEVEDAPTDLMEWIDVIILGFDGAWRTGAHPHEIIEMLQHKQDVNFKREYPKPKSQDHPSEHIRGASKTRK